MKTHKALVSVEESSVARKRVWTYERPPGGTSAATRPLHAHRRVAMEQIINFRFKPILAKSSAVPRSGPT